jgi:hypothetical protein
MNRLQILNSEMNIDLSLVNYSILFKLNVLELSIVEFSWLVSYIKAVKKLTKLKSNLLCDYLTGIPTKIDLKVSPQVSAFDIDVTH